LTFNGIHSVISWKTELFITTAVKTSNPTIIIFATNNEGYYNKTIEEVGTTNFLGPQIDSNLN
jgi:hypothetical protein